MVRRISHLLLCRGDFLLFACFARLGAHSELPRFPALCDRSSYRIYLAHVLPIYLANDLIYRLGSMCMATAYLFRLIFTYTVTFACCLGYTFLQEKIKERLQNANRSANQKRA